MADILPDGVQAPFNIDSQLIEGLIRYYGPSEAQGLSEQNSVDLPGFFGVVKDIIDDFQERRDVSEQARVNFSEEGPPVGSETEHITYRLISRVPGKVSGGRHGASTMGRDGRREWKPRLRYTKEDDGNITQKQLVLGQFYDNVVEFSCWAQTNKQANDRALWFEDLMTTYHWYFRWMGVSEVFFLRRLEDKAYDGQLGGNTLKQRSLQYFVRTDRMYSIKQTVLRDMILRVGVGSGLNS